MARASEQVWALVSGLPSRDRSQRLLMVYQAFIDDSGSEPQSPVIVLAGFVANHAEWAKFSDEWDAALKVPPALGYFKMTEAANLAGEFSKDKGWTKAKRDERVVGLARIIRKHVKTQVAGVMPYDAFMRHIASLSAIARRLATDNPYPFLFLQTVLAVAVRGDLYGIDSACDFIFDEQLGFQEEILGWWPQTRALIDRAPRSDIAQRVWSPPIFRNEKEFLPLQAADLYAWQVRYNYIRNNAVPGQTIIMPPTRAFRVLEPLPEIYLLYSEEALLRLRAHLLKIGEQFVTEFPNTALIPLSDDPSERRRQRRRARLAAKAAAVSLPASAADDGQPL